MASSGRSRLYRLLRADFWDTMGPFEEPMADRLFDTVLGLGADNVSDKIGIGILALAGVGIAAHAALACMSKDKE